MASDLTRLGLRGLKFRPYRSRTKRGFGGVEVLINPNDTPDLMPAAMALCAEVVARSGKAPLTASPASTRSLFDKVYGSQALWQTLTTGASWQDLVTDWASSLTAFEAERRPFLLYN